MVTLGELSEQQAKALHEAALRIAPSAKPIMRSSCPSSTHAALERRGLIFYNHTDGGYWELDPEGMRLAAEHHQALYEEDLLDARDRRAREREAEARERAREQAIREARIEQLAAQLEPALGAEAARELAESFRYSDEAAVPLKIETVRALFHYRPDEDERLSDPAPEPETVEISEPRQSALDELL